MVAPALLLVTGLLAGLGPARRAGRVDPAVTLRSDWGLPAGISVGTPRRSLRRGVPTTHSLNFLNL